MKAIPQAFLRIQLTVPETGLFHQVLEFYYQKCFDIWLPRSASLDGLRAQVQVHASQEEEMTFNLWGPSAHALLSLFEKEPEEEEARQLGADLQKEIKVNVEKLTTRTYI